MPYDIGDPSKDPKFENYPYTLQDPYSDGGYNPEFKGIGLTTKGNSGIYLQLHRGPFSWFKAYAFIQVKCLALDSKP